MMTGTQGIITLNALENFYDKKENFQHIHPNKMNRFKLNLSQITYFYVLGK
jgi:hypothetical protein